MKSRIVSAVGVAVGHDGSQAGIKRAKRVEAAMSGAISQAQAAGVMDQNEIRARMLAARDEASSAG